MRMHYGRKPVIENGIVIENGAKKITIRNSVCLMEEIKSKGGNRRTNQQG